jgi:hypothetical protein
VVCEAVAEASLAPQSPTNATDVSSE